MFLYREKKGKKEKDEGLYNFHNINPTIDNYIYLQLTFKKSVSSLYLDTLLSTLSQLKNLFFKDSF